MTGCQRVRDALAYIPARDRETWVRMGMAVKAELGDGGFPVWDEWSQQDESYNERDARAVWRSISPNGKVTAGTLFREAQRRGYRPNRDEVSGRNGPLQFSGRVAGHHDSDDRQREQIAQQQAVAIWEGATAAAAHPYLASKGVKPCGAKMYRGPLAVGGMRCDEALIVPMRDVEDAIHSLQFIDAAGEKRFLSGGAKTGHYFLIGDLTTKVVICEGFATGATIHEATGVSVAVAFDAGNLVHVAKALRTLGDDTEIVIAADNDQWTDGNPGVKKALEAAEAVAARLVIPTFRDESSRPTDFNDLYRLEGFPAVREAFDPPPSPEPGSGPVLSVFSVPGRGHWPEPEPLPALPGVAKFDEDLLPEALRAYVVDIADRMQCPPDFVAAAAIAMVGSAVGRQIGIRPKRKDNWTVIPNVWAMIVGRSGIMKSPAMSAALAPLRQLQAEAFRQHEADLQSHELAARVAKLTIDEAEARARRLIKDGKAPQAQAVLAEAREITSEMPRARRFIVNDSTVEALAETLEENPNGVLVDRDELAGWLKSLDKEGQQEARAFYLTAADGDKGFTTDRIGRGRNRHIPAVCVSIAGAIQPGVLAHYVRETQRDGSGDDGLLQRFGIMVYPDVSLQWRNVDRPPSREARQTMDTLVERLCALDLDNVGAEVDGPETTPYLHFEGAAQTLLDDWRAALEEQLRLEDEHPAIVSHLSKYRKLVPSLALINHLCDAGCGPVSEAALMRSIRMSLYLETHARRVYSYASRPDVDAAKTILGKIKAGKLPPIFAAAKVYRAGWSGLATSEEAWAAIRLLVDHNYLREVEYKRETGRPGKTFRVHPSVMPPD